MEGMTFHASVKALEVMTFPVPRVWRQWSCCRIEDVENCVVSSLSLIYILHSSQNEHGSIPLHISSKHDCTRFTSFPLCFLLAYRDGIRKMVGRENQNIKPLISGLRNRIKPNVASVPFELPRACPCPTWQFYKQMTVGLFERAN